MPVAESEMRLFENDELGIGMLTMGLAHVPDEDEEPPGISEMDFKQLEQSKHVPKPIVGIIFPPPEVRNIVDKTASFVARNGPDFETRIRSNELNNPKFNFLSSSDPYHAYYQSKVAEIRDGKSAVQSDVSLASESLKSSQQLIEEAKRKKGGEVTKVVEPPFVPKDPPAEFEFTADPPSISAHDLDVVKLTALFVARNGRQFLSTLMTREQRNFLFDFLRPQHSLFTYFTRLLEQYTKMLIPPKDIGKKLSGEERNKVLEEVKYRANWIKYQEGEKKKTEEVAEKERLAYSSIDWHDFVVVETVEYEAFEQGQFPPPTTPEEVGARVLLQDRLLQGQTMAEKEETPTPDDTQVQDMEEDSSSSSSSESEEEEEKEGPKNEKNNDKNDGKNKNELGIPEPPGEVIIKKGYDPKQGKWTGGTGSSVVRPGPKPEEYTISPITGERIPVSKLQEHMRIGLLDPKWKDQRDKQMMEKVNQESVFAAGFAVDESLKQFAERRSDIFGVGVEETPIGKKVGEEERIPGMPWEPTSTLNIPTGAPPPTPDESSTKGDEGKKDIGPIVSGPTPPQPPLPTLLKVPPPPLPQIPGLVRPLGLPPQPPPGMLLLPPLRPLPPMMGLPPHHAPPPPHGGAPHPPPPQFTPFGGGRPPPMLPPGLPPPPLRVAGGGGGGGGGEEEPAAKKTKSMEDALIPEDQFLASNRSPTTFTVLLPNMPDKPEMGLSGGMIQVRMELTEPISYIKTKVAELIGLAPGKQKLSVDGLFFKDSNSLAFYNIGEGTQVLLSLKERGGRKK